MNVKPEGPESVFITKTLEKSICSIFPNTTKIQNWKGNSNYESLAGPKEGLLRC